MNSQAKTGLEWVQAVMNGDTDEPAMSQTVPMKGISAEQGHVIFEVIADDRHTNMFGGVHGGFAATVIDSITGCAIHTMLDAQQTYATIDLNVKLCRPIPKDTPLIAEGIMLNLSKSLGIADATIKDNDGKVYAYGSATCMILTNPAST